MAIQLQLLGFSPRGTRSAVLPTDFRINNPCGIYRFPQKVTFTVVDLWLKFISLRMSPVIFVGVWHICGLGKSPGAITVPLTCIYLLLKAASKGNSKAREFFELSGEAGQELKGAPECLVIFTSKEVLEEIEIGREIRDAWLNTSATGPLPHIIKKYLKNLLEQLEDSDFTKFYKDQWIKSIYFIKVDVQSFWDCFEKIGITMNALKDKELWVNMVGGTNQINAASLVAGTMLAAVARYYYFFQSKINLLHPDIKKPDFRSPHNCVDDIIKMWQDIPLFQLDIGSVITNIYELFKNRNVVNINEVKQKLNELKLAQDTYLPKLRGRLIKIEGHIAYKGPWLDRLYEMSERIKRQDIKNVSSWIRWGQSEGILIEENLD